MAEQRYQAVLAVISDRLSISQVAGKVGVSRPYWGPRRLVFELAKRQVVPVPSESAAYRALVRAGMVDAHQRDRRRAT